MPKQDRLVISLATGLSADYNLGQFGMDVFLAQDSPIDMGPEGAEFAGAKLAEIVDDDFVHDGGQRQFQRAHRAIGNHQSAALDKVPLEMLDRDFEARCLDHDVSACKTAAPIGRHDDLLVQVFLEPCGKGLTALRPERMHPDLSK